MIPPYLLRRVVPGDGSMTRLQMTAQLRKVCGSRYSPLAWFRAWRFAGHLIEDGATGVEVYFEDVL